jgi:hypothetical protein
MSAAGDESGGAAALPQGPVPVEHVKAANGLEKVVLREVRGNSVEVRYCCAQRPLSLSLSLGSARHVFRRSDLGADPWRWMLRSRSVCNRCSDPDHFPFVADFPKRDWKIDRSKPVMN